MAIEKGRISEGNRGARATKGEDLYVLRDLNKPVMIDTNETLVFRASSIDFTPRLKLHIL